jgi:hypothetical protein
MAIIDKTGVDYIFSVKQDTANGSVYKPNLVSELTIIPVVLVEILVRADELRIRFSDKLETGLQEPQLNSIVASHSGVGNIEQIFESEISEEVEDYAMSLFYDTRLRLGTDYRGTRLPIGYLKAITLIDRYGTSFPDTVRTKSSDEAAMVRAFNNSESSIEKLAYWSAYRKVRDGN